MLKKATKLRILVTGATGFIGKHLVRFLANSGHSIIALSRSGEKVGGANTQIAYMLGELPNLSSSLSIEAAIHLAHDYRSGDGANRTITGTIDLFESLVQIGVRRQIFVSSYSAGPHAQSIYGRTKGSIEALLKEEPSALIVRPGLVIGSGGIFARIASWARHWPIVPLPDGGRGVVPIIEIERLCQEIAQLCEMADPPREFNAFHESKISLRDLVLNVAREDGRKPLILPIPTTCLLPLLRLAEVLGVKLPVSSDSLIGFVSNQMAEHPANLGN